MQEEVLDPFEDLSAWSAITSGEAQLTLAQDRGPDGNAALRLDFDFRGGGGFVVARKVFPLLLPESYSFAFSIRGRAPSNIFEFKLVDASGQNVWRHRVEAFAIPEDWQPVRIRNSQVEFAWGPLGGGPARDIAAIEVVIAAGPGGAGSVWLADLRFRDDTYRATPRVSASASADGCVPENVLAGDASVWRCQGVEAAWLAIDFQQEREFGGLVVHWDSPFRAREFRVGVSSDGVHWRKAYATRQGSGERSYIYLPGTVCRWVRLDLLSGVASAAFGIRQVEIKPSDFARSLNNFFEGIARDYPLGFHPKYLSGRQTYWTPVGAGSGESQALFNEEGMVEVDRGSFSIEPFLHAGGRLVTWADAELTQTLERGDLPIPSSVWQTADWRLTSTAFATGDTEHSVLFLRYRIENLSEACRAVTLFAAIRPFQVTPTWQHWREFGGMSRVEQITVRDRVVWVNGSKAIVPLTAAQGFGSAAFAEGTVTEFLARGELPFRAELQDEFGYGSGALRFDRAIPPGAWEDIYLAIPFGSVAEGFDGTLGDALGAAQFERACQFWAARLDGAEIRLPAEARGIAETLRTAAAHILINRDGPALHPGPRRYSRAWIRDGVLMGAALLRIGCPEALRDFVRWYAGYQRESGELPDCVDRQETEWLPEFDAYGQFLYGVMEYWRFTHDTVFLAEVRPAVAKTLGFLEALRERRLAPEYQTTEKRACRGLLPESMSHEGYMAHPVHAYWDDFWALRGLKDGAAMAQVLGDTAEVRRISVLLEDFSRDVYASLALVIAKNGIDFVPGSVEFADFDPAATAIALAPVDELHHLPRPAIDRTFDKYLAGFRDRAGGAVPWNNYSAYEIRIVGALVRLGRRQDALELLEYLLNDRRIRPWNQWPEISWRDPQGPSFIGDLPHTWISGEYILAARSLFAYEREEDESLVIAAGLSGEWLKDGFEIAVNNLPTHYGKLAYTLRQDGPETLVLNLHANLSLPKGGIIVKPPLPRPILQVWVNGKELARFEPDGFCLHECPAEAVLQV